MPFRKPILANTQREFRFDFILVPEPDYTIFELFLALPKELREEIYTIIFSSPEDLKSRVLVRDQVRPIEPAICRVSKIVRDEALPLFYHLYELRIEVLTVVTKRRKPRLTFGTEFWQRIPVQKFVWLRNVRITFLDTALYYGRRLCIELKIRFFTMNGKHQYSLDVVADPSPWRLGECLGYTNPSNAGLWLRWPFSQSIFDEHAEKVTGEIRAQSITVLDWLISDEKFGKWTPADFKWLVEWDESLLHRS